MSAADDADLRAKFEREGYLIIKNFATQDECDGMRRRMAELIEAWDPLTSESSVFTTDENQLANQANDDYFLQSGDKIHFFLEEAATDPATKKLKPGVDKATSLNKVGHGLHLADPIFKAYSSSEKVGKLTRTLGWEHPVLPQSMYIFKPARVGGAVTSHQDSTFLWTEPRQSCLGLWLALQDATLDNGCLWCRPGSHREPIRRRMVRNPAYFDGGMAASGQPMTKFEAGEVGSEGTKPWEWEGKMPEDHEAVGFISAPVNAGDLFVIHGAIDHMSLPNTSAKGRETFQLHLVEGEKAGVQWSASNWLQYPQGKAFPEL